MHSCQGQCHCGNIGVEIQLSAQIHSITAQLCRCRFCRLHGAMWIGKPVHSLKLEAETAEHVQLYFDRSIDATYLLCSNCGTVASVLAFIEDKMHAAVNSNVLNLSPDVDLDVLHCQSHPNLTARQALRQDGWINEIDFCPELQRRIFTGVKEEKRHSETLV